VVTISTSRDNRPRGLGIDLGTTNTCAAFADGRIAKIIPTDRGANLIPSVVAFSGNDGENVLVGRPAKEQLLINPTDTVYGSKRLVGRPFHSPQVQRLRAHFAYHIVEGDRGQCAVEIKGRRHALTDISSIILRQIGSYAGTHLGAPVEGAIITVPAYYPLSQRQAVRQAGRQAGLDVWRLLNEPTAAAIAYGIRRTHDQRVLVFDLGGGTFDVSVLELGGGTFQVLATGGDGYLGGVDFDILLATRLLEDFEKSHGLSLRGDATVMQRVMSAAEAAKCDLSLLQHTEVRLPFVASRRGKAIDLVSTMNRSDLVELTRPLVDRCIAKVEQALSVAGLSVDDIDEVLLAGGQTRMPYIQTRIEELFRKPPRRGVNPDEVVAQGAALLARSLGGDGPRLIDVLSVPIGIARQLPDGSRVLEPVLMANTALPHEAVVHVDNTEANQAELSVDVFQGFGTRLEDAEYIGSVLYDGMPLGAPRTRRLTLHFHIDVDGVVSIKAHHAGEHTARQLHLMSRAPDYVRRYEQEAGTREASMKPGEEERSGLLRWIFGGR